MLWFHWLALYLFVGVVASLLFLRYSGVSSMFDDDPDDTIARGLLFICQTVLWPMIGFYAAAWLVGWVVKKITKTSYQP